MQISLDGEAPWSSEDFQFRKGEVAELSFVADDEAEGKALLGIVLGQIPGKRTVRGEVLENRDWIFAILG